jgi:predicted transposase YdaD
MPKPFDITLKQLLADFAPDWVSWLAPRFGLPPGIKVEPLDAELSSVQVAADKVFRLQPPAEGILHLEPQSSWDGTLADRLLFYNVLLQERYGGPVYSTALLLRRDANSPNLAGELIRSYADGTDYLRFRYAVVRVWQLEMEPLLQAGPGLYPLALLTDEAAPRLGELVNRLDEQMRADNLPDQTRLLIHTSSLLLLGMRYNAEEMSKLFLRVQGMHESTTYQAILREGRDEGLKLGRQEGLQAGRQEGLQAGRQEGQIEARQDDLIDLLQERFGVVPDELTSQIRTTRDLPRLRQAMRRALQAPTLAEFALELRTSIL